MAGSPEILLLDEPLSSLDAQSRGSLRSLIRDLAACIPGPTVYVTHDETDVVELAEAVVTIEGGKVSDAGPEGPSRASGPVSGSPSANRDSP